MPALALVLAASVFDLQKEGNILPFALLFGFGMVVGMCGHLWGSREMVLAGILIAGVTAVMPWVMWS